MNDPASGPAMRPEGRSGSFASWVPRVAVIEPMNGRPRVDSVAPRGGKRCGKHVRFDPHNASRDLSSTPVVGAAWAYQSPQLYLPEIARGHLSREQPAGYSVSESAAAEVTAQKRRTEMARFCAEIDEMNARAREDALDGPAPATVRAYRQVCGHNLRGWPPA